MITEFVVTAGGTRKRLDVFLRHREPDISRSGLQRLIEHGRIRVNAQVVKPSQKIKPGDSITMDAPQPGPLALRGETIPLEVLYEDEVLLVVNKPAGIVVHPTSGNWSGTLVNALLSHFQNAEGTVSTMSGKTRPGLVHRLGKDTSKWGSKWGSGLIVPHASKWTDRNSSNRLSESSISAQRERIRSGLRVMWQKLPSCTDEGGGHIQVPSRYFFKKICK